VRSSVGSFFQSKKLISGRFFGKCYLKRSPPSFEISPLRCHYLEAAFSTINIIKSRMRGGLRLFLTGLPIDIDELAAQRQAQSFHSLSFSFLLPANVPGQK
jgi:hypothetical protein